MMDQTFGDDWPIASPPMVGEVTGEDIFSSALIQHVRSASIRGRVIQLSVERPYRGLNEYIRMKEVPVDGLTAGGSRRMDKRQKNLVAWIVTVFVILVVISVFLLFLSLCWWGIYSALHAIF